MYKLIFHPDIHHEIRNAYKWYELQSLGLGEDFLTELESSYQFLKELPYTWPLISMNFRRYLLNRFPYGIIYQIKKNEIYIVAVMHLSRNPGYWME